MPAKDLFQHYCAQFGGTYIKNRMVTLGHGGALLDIDRHILLIHEALQGDLDKQERLKSQIGFHHEASRQIRNEAPLTRSP